MPAVRSIPPGGGGGVRWDACSGTRVTGCILISLHIARGVGLPPSTYSKQHTLKQFCFDVGPV